MLLQRCRVLVISTHSPRVGRDSIRVRLSSRHINFNPLSPCGERRGSFRRYLIIKQISTHSPRVGRDVSPGKQSSSYKQFQPTLPVWGETPLNLKYINCIIFQPTLPVWGETYYSIRFFKDFVISTHSPRVGRDCFARDSSACGRLFQPTLPVWGETLGG